MSGHRGLTSTKIGAGYNNSPHNSSEEFIFKPQDGSQPQEITKTVEFKTCYEVDADEMGHAR